MAESTAPAPAVSANVEATTRTQARAAGAKRLTELLGSGEPDRDHVKCGEPAYFTPAQVAELLQVSVKSVSRWALEDASMPVLRRGRVVRFERERLLAWLARQEPRAARRSTRTAQEATNDA